ncbi:MAG: hypothetical protein KJZ74_12695 [Gemmatimonadales bacterium]|nr:hypothetical protein [Gemmatimonadales bacterium]
MPFQGQWADSLLALERAFLMRIVLWSLMTLLLGTALVAWLRVRNVESALVRGFAVHSAAWGATLLILSALGTRTAELRDLAGATALDRRVWLLIGLCLGVTALGATLARAAYVLGRRLDLVGAGIAVSVQGCAIALLSLQFASALVR